MREKDWQSEFGSSLHPISLHSAGDVSLRCGPKIQKAIPAGRDNLPFDLVQGSRWCCSGTSAGVRRVKFTAETGFNVVPIGSGTTVNAGDGMGCSRA